MKPIYLAQTGVVLLALVIFGWTWWSPASKISASDEEWVGASSNTTDSSQTRAGPERSEDNASIVPSRLGKPASAAAKTQVNQARRARSLISTSAFNALPEDRKLITATTDQELAWMKAQGFPDGTPTDLTALRDRVDSGQSYSMEDLNRLVHELWSRGDPDFARYHGEADAMGSAYALRLSTLLQTRALTRASDDEQFYALHETVAFCSMLGDGYCNQIAWRNLERVMPVGFNHYVLQVRVQSAAFRFAAAQDFRQRRGLAPLTISRPIRRI